MPPKRITPAHAGKSIRPGEPKLRPEDHPRTRGEKKVYLPPPSRGTGSPPHTRGKGVVHHIVGPKVGITPAHTGKSMVWKALLTSGRDHPRTRGEKPHRISVAEQPAGSPPHTRGKALDLDAPLQHKEDHPRTRGEKQPGLIKQSFHLGSPPHTRGKVVLVENGAGQVRITPAHAGKSPWTAPKRQRNGDHPRTRGEKPVVRIWIRNHPGITPAHAGKSLWRWYVPGYTEDHPRTRGEKTKRIPILSHCFQVKGSFSFSFS